MRANNCTLKNLLFNQCRNVDPNPLGSVINDASPGSRSIIEYGSGSMSTKIIEKNFCSRQLICIQKICKMFLATMPVTQVSVKRLFSALKLLKSELRNKPKDDIGDVQGDL